MACRPREPSLNRPNSSKSVKLVSYEGCLLMNYSAHQLCWLCQELRRWAGKFCTFNDVVAKIWWPLSSRFLLFSSVLFNISLYRLIAHFVNSFPVHTRLSPAALPKIKQCGFYIKLDILLSRLLLIDGQFMSAYWWKNRDSLHSLHYTLYMQHMSHH